MIFLVPLLLIAGGGIAVVAVLLSGDDPPNHEPDVPMDPVSGAPTVPGSTGYKRVDAMLDKLKAAASSSGIPLGVLVGWIAKESGGKLEEVTKLDERGVFQLMPDESKSIGVDHQRLSTDLDYSIAAGVKLIQKYMGQADNLRAFSHGSEDFFKLVKLIHTQGGGDTKTLVDAAKAVGQMGSWESFESFALGGNVHTKHSPAKWFPFIDKLFAVGTPFGVGGASTMVAGWFDAASVPAYTDIPDVLALMPNKGRRR